MTQLTPARVLRRLLIVVGRRMSSSMRIDGPPLAGWAPIRRASGTLAWLKCYGRSALRYTEPEAYLHARRALTQGEALQLRQDFYRRGR